MGHLLTLLDEMGLDETKWDDTSIRIELHRYTWLVDSHYYCFVDKGLKVKTLHSSSATSKSEWFYA